MTNSNMTDSDNYRDNHPLLVNCRNIHLTNGDDFIKVIHLDIFCKDCYLTTSEIIFTQIGTNKHLLSFSAFL